MRLPGNVVVRSIPGVARCARPHSRDRWLDTLHDAETRTGISAAVRTSNSGEFEVARARYDVRIANVCAEPMVFPQSSCRSKRGDRRAIEAAEVVAAASGLRARPAKAMKASEFFHEELSLDAICRLARGQSQRDTRSCASFVASLRDWVWCRRWESNPHGG
jgi:hypothetical protein